MHREPTRQTGTKTGKNIQEKRNGKQQENMKPQETEQETNRKKTGTHRNITGPKTVKRRKPNRKKQENSRKHTGTKQEKHEHDK